MTASAAALSTFSSPNGYAPDLAFMDEEFIGPRSWVQAVRYHSDQQGHWAVLLADDVVAGDQPDKLWVEAFTYHREAYREVLRNYAR